MTAAAGMMLLTQVMPLIAAAIARGAVKPTGCEDVEELTAEGVALAAQGLESIEKRGKQVSPNSIAYYAIERLKSGRRSGSAGRTDVMAPATQVVGRSTVVSLDAPVVMDDNDDQDATLHDVLAAQDEDVDVAAGRHVDWAAVMTGLDDRRQAVLTAMAAGYGTNTIADQLQLSPPRICQLKESLGAHVVDAWGADGVADACTPSKWRAGLRAGAERRTGRYERVHRGRSR